MPGAQVVGMYSPFTANDPQVSVTIDREKAKAIGVPMTQITAAMSTFMGSTYVNDFDFNNRSYRVYVQADQQYRRTRQDLQQYLCALELGLDGAAGQPGRADETSGPQVIYHYNLFRSAEIDGSPAPGLSSGQGLDAMENLFNKNKLQGMTYSWTGLALEEEESAGKAIIIFGLGLLVVYLTLSAQYESFALPFIILLAVPMAILGALALVAARGLVDDVYVQIGLVMLIGLVGEELDSDRGVCGAAAGQGRTIVEAAIEAAELRLRPILMTSVAFILGVMPLYCRDRRGRPGTALGRHGGGGRHGAFDGAEPGCLSRCSMYCSRDFWDSLAEGKGDRLLRLSRRRTSCRPRPCRVISAGSLSCADAGPKSYSSGPHLVADVPGSS